MPISSFYGLQTSLRGLLAQQRLLDTTGHNIANASTQGYSRQEASLVASPALEIPAGGIAGGSGAHLGSGVDVQSFRRVRDHFLDLQYRGQNTQPRRRGRRASTALDQAELRARRARRQRHQRAARPSSGTPGRTSPTRRRRPGAAKQALVEQARGAGRRASTRVRAQLAPVERPGDAPSTDLARPRAPATRAARSRRSRPSIAEPQRHDQALRHRRRRAERPDRPPRPAARPALRVRPGLGRPTTADGTINVAFVDAPSAPPPLVDRHDRHWAGPPAGDAWSPGGQLGGLLDVSKPGGTLDGYLDQLDTIADNARHDGQRRLRHAVLRRRRRPDGRHHRVSAALLASPQTLARRLRRGRLATTSRPRSSQLRGGAASTSAYRAFVAKVGADVREADRQEANAQVLADSVENRRQSVAGVSLDEEMSNLVRFQRAYQASARAMSTMDEMLDVLINRTGRVGL